MTIRDHLRKRMSMLSGHLPSIKSGPKKKGHRMPAMPRLKRLSQNAKRPSVVLHWSKIMGIFSGQVQMLLLSCILFVIGSLETFGSRPVARYCYIHVDTLAAALYGLFTLAPGPSPIPFLYI